MWFWLERLLWVVLTGYVLMLAISIVGIAVLSLFPGWPEPPAPPTPTWTPGNDGT